ncbi:Taste receptor type 2 member 9, partial [Mesitornis unicolor]
NNSSYDVMATAVITLQALVGMWINAFIASVLCITWVKKKTFNSSDKILLFLGCSRFWYLCISLALSIVSISFPLCFYVHPFPELFLSIQSFLNFCNLWASACLCGFYCIKIGNFRHIFFIYLKLKIDRIVPWLLLSSVFLSLVIGAVVFNITGEALCNDHNCTSQGDFWKLSAKRDEHFFPAIFIVGFGFATAFTAVIFSAFLLLFSLCKHKHRMLANSASDLSVDVHIKAIKSILSFFVIYSINFTCLILSLIYSRGKTSPETFVILVLLYAFPTVHSLILIFSNPKLEKTLLRTL